MLEHPRISKYRKVTIFDRCGQSAGKALAINIVKESSETTRQTSILVEDDIVRTAWRHAELLESRAE